MNEILELFPVAEYSTDTTIDRSRKAVDRKNKKQEIDELVSKAIDELFDDWENRAVSPMAILLEFKLNEIKKILSACDPSVQQTFATRLAEWVFDQNTHDL